MGTISRTAFNTGDIPTAAEWNTQFDTAYNEINGSLDANNLASDAVSTVKIQNSAVSKAKLGDIPQIVSFSLESAYAGTRVRSMMFPWAGTLTQVSVLVGKAAGPQNLVVDVKNAGVTMLNASAASATGTSVQEYTGSDIISTSIAANAILSLDILQIGTATAGGEPLTVNLYIDVAGSAM